MNAAREDARDQVVVEIGVNHKWLLTPERKMFIFTSFQKVTMSENYQFFLIVFNVSLSFRLFQEEMARLQNNLEKLKSQGSEDDIEEKVLLVEQVKQGTNCVGISSMSSLFFRKDWS